jgi:cytoskeleton protein RodZ
MSETVAAAAAAPPAPPSFGAPLAAARESLGLSQAEVAGRLRLHARQIAALEAEQMAALPEATFIRGFIRNYAKEVRIDPAPLLSALDARVGPLPDLRALGPGPAPVVRGVQRERLSRQFVILGSIGLLVGLGAIGWLATQRAAVPTAPVVQAPPTTAAAPVVAAAAATASDPAPTEGVATAVPAAGSPTGAGEPTGASTAPPAASPLLRISVGDRPSWIEVVQGNDGRVVFSGLSDAGTERQVQAMPPLRLIVGNASSVRLEYRGRPVDLVPHTRNDLARLTLD